MSQDNLVSRASSLHSRLLSLPNRFGLAVYSRSCVVVKEFFEPGEFIPTMTRLTLAPNPKVEPVPTRLVGSVVDNNVIISNRDLQVSDIPQTYSENDLNGVWEIDGVYGYSVLFVKPKTTTYEVVLRTPVDKPGL